MDDTFIQLIITQHYSYTAICSKQQCRMSCEIESQSFSDYFYLFRLYLHLWAFKQSIYNICVDSHSWCGVYARPIQLIIWFALFVYDPLSNFSVFVEMNSMKIYLLSMALRLNSMFFSVALLMYLAMIRIENKCLHVQNLNYFACFKLTWKNTHFWALFELEWISPHYQNIFLVQKNLFRVSKWTKITSGEFKVKRLCESYSD